MAKGNEKSGGSGSGSNSNSSAKSGAANVKLANIPRLNYSTTDKSSARGRGREAYTRQNIADQKSNKGNSTSGSSQVGTGAQGQQPQGRNFLAETVEASNGQRRSNNEYQKQKEKTRFLDEAQNGREAAKKKAQDKARGFSAEANDLGRYGKGNIDLHDRNTGLHDENGNLMTVRSMSFNEDGKEVLVPTIVKRDGKWTQLSDDEAIDWYHRTGEHLGKFDSVEEANQYADRLHKQQESLYVPKGNEKDQHADNYQSYLNEADRLTVEKTNSEGLTMEEQDEYDRRIKEAKDKAEEERKAAGIKNAKEKWDDLRSAPLLSEDEQEAWAFLGPNEEVENQVGGWGRQFASGPAMMAGTALQWFDKASDDMVRYEYDQEHGEGAYDAAIAGKNVNQVGQIGGKIWDTGVGLRESGEQMWEAGIADMSDLGKEIATVGKAGADLAADAALNFVMPGLGTMRMYMGAMGDASYEQSQRENNDIDSRMLSMVKAGASAYLSNKLVGDVIYGKGIIPKGIDKMLANVSPEVQKVVRPLLNSEGVQEGVENIMNWGADIILGLDTGKPLDWNEVKQDAFIGYVLGVLTNGLAGGMNIDSKRQQAIAQEAVEFAESGLTVDEAAEIGKQNTRDQVVIKAKPESETSSPAAQPQQDSTGTAWTGDWDSWVNTALSGGALSDTDVDTIYNRPAARQAFEKATGISLNGMTEEDAKATIGMAAGTQTIEPTAEATAKPGATENNANLTPEENAIVDEIDRVAAERAELQEWNDSVYRPGTEEKYYDRRTGKEVSLEEVQGKAARLEELNNRFDELVEQAPSPERMQQASATAAETEANENTSEAEPEQEANDTGKQNETENNASTNTNQDQNQQNQQGEKNEQSRKTDHTKKTTNPNDETDAEFDKLNTKYGSIDKGEKAARDINVPKKDTKGMKVGEGARTIFEADATPEERVASLKAAVVNGNFGHIPVKNDTRSKNAAKKIAKDGWSQSVSDFLAAVDSGRADADTIALGAHLLNEAGNSTECSGKQYVQLAMAYNDAVSDAGSRLAAGRILKTLTPEGKLYGMEKTVEKMNREIRKNNEKKKPGKQKAEIKLNEQLVEDYLNAKTDEERNKIQDKLVKDTAAQVPNTFRDKFTALRYLNMLGNFKTQFRNLAGNTGMTIVQKTKNEARGAIEGLVKAATGGKYEQQYKGGPGLAKRLKVASEDFVSDADLQAMAMGEKKFSDVAKQSESEIKDAKDPFSNKNPLGKFLNAYSKATNAAMELGDLVFVRANYADALAGYMNAHNISEADWKAMVNDPSKSAEVDKARAFAIKQAQEATFRDSNAVSKFASTFDQRWPGAAKKVAQGVIPFRKTPANVLVRMEEYSPLGVINTAVKGIQAAKGTAEASAVIDSAAKSLTGTGLTVLGILMASMGKARTKDDDKNEEAFAKLKGQQDYSVEVGGTSMTMDWLSPASAPFFMGVEAYNLAKDGNFKLADLFNAAMTITNPMLEMSMLSGVNDALNNLNDFNGDNSAIAQFVLNSAWSYLTQGISNTMLGQVEQFSEKYRQTYYTDSDNPLLPTWAQKKVSKLMNKTPLPKYGDYQAADYIDAWGRKQANDPNLAERAWNVFLNPGYVSKMDQKATEADAVIDNLLQFSKTQKERDDFPNVVPKSPSRNETVNGKKLTPEEYDVYATTKGQESLKAVTELSKSDVFKGMDEFAQGEAIYAAYEYAEFLAASKIAKSRGEEYKDTKFDGLEDTDHPALVVGVKAGFNDGKNHENWDGIDSLLKAANSGKMSKGDLEYLDGVQGFRKLMYYSDQGVGSKDVHDVETAAKEKAKAEYRTDANATDLISTLIEGKYSPKVTDAFMGMESNRNEENIQNQVRYEMDKLGKSESEIQTILKMMQEFDDDEVSKAAIVKEATKNVPKKEQNRIKDVITNWTKDRHDVGKSRNALYESMRKADDRYTLDDFDRYWSAMDKNGDGQITKKEYNGTKKKIPSEYRDDITKYLYEAMGW